MHQASNITRDIQWAQPFGVVQLISTFTYKSLDRLKFTPDIFFSEKCLQEKNGRVYQDSESCVNWLCVCVCVVKRHRELRHRSVIGEYCALVK